MRIQQQQLEIEKQRLALEEKRREDELRLKQEKQQLENQRIQMQLLEKRRQEELALIEQQRSLELQRKQLREEQAKLEQLRLQELQKPAKPPPPQPPAKPHILRKQPELPPYSQFSPSDTSDEREIISPGGWRTAWPIRPPDVKNKITNSTEMLNEEKYDIDWWARRGKFLEQPEPEPEINYVGKVWQPPQEGPLSLPQRKGLPKEFVPLDDKEHTWQPYILEPEFRYERKNYTPIPSPPPTHKTISSTPIPGRTPVHFGPISPGFQTQPLPPRANVDVTMRVHPPPSSSTPTPSMSSLAFSEPNLPQRFDHRRGPSYVSPRPTKHVPTTPVPLENEPTPRHPSTITVTDKPRVDIRSKIEAFEPSEVDPHLPIREFGTYATRQYALQSSQYDDGDRGLRQPKQVTI